METWKRVAMVGSAFITGTLSKKEIYNVSRLLNSAIIGWQMDKY